jgi:tetratricopeptide (TPR) repeat protein
MTVRVERSPAAKGALLEKPFCHLLIDAHRRNVSGTLIIVADACGEVSIRLQRGRATRALIANPMSSSNAQDLFEALLPLCALQQGSFSFFEEDLLTGVVDAISGQVDPYTLLGASLRNYCREDVIDGVLRRCHGTRLRLPPKREVERLRLEPRDAPLLELIRAAPSTPDELIAHAPLPRERTRSVVYALIVTHMLVAHDEFTQQTARSQSIDPGVRSGRPAGRSSPAWQALASLRPDLSVRVGNPNITPRPDSGPLSPLPSGAPVVHVSRRPSSGRIPIVTPASLIPDDDIPARIRRAEVYMQRGRHDEAITEVDSMLKLEPTRAELYGLRAQILFDKHSQGEPSGLPRSVIDALKRALEIDADEVRALFTRGLVCKRGGDARKALVYFKRVLQIDPKHLEAERELRLAKLRGG